MRGECGGVVCGARSQALLGNGSLEALLPGFEAELRGVGFQAELGNQVSQGRPEARPTKRELFATVDSQLTAEPVARCEWNR